MECLGLEPGAAGRKAQTNPMSYGGTLTKRSIFRYIFVMISCTYLSNSMDHRVFRFATIGQCIKGKQC